MTFRQVNRLGLGSAAIAGVLAVFACSSSSGGGAPSSSSAGAQAGSAGSGAGSAGTAGTDTGGAGAGGAGAAGDAGFPMTPDGACRASFEAQCEARVRCGEVTDLASCTDRAQLCPEYYFSDGSTRSVDVIFACLDTLRNQPCAELLAGIVPACLTAGTKADAAPCRYSTQCASGLCDTNTDPSCGACEHVPGPNETCTRTFGCVTGYYCNPASSQCVANPTYSPAAEGQPCDVSGAPFVACQGTLACGPTATSTASICQVLPTGENTPCPVGQCARPFLCSAPTAGSLSCTAPTCGTGPDCPAGSECFTGVDADGGSGCVPTAQLNEPCNAPLEFCAIGLTCSPNSGTCITELHRGDPCQPGDCPDFLACTNGVCSPPENTTCP